LSSIIASPCTARSLHEDQQTHDAVSQADHQTKPPRSGPTEPAHLATPKTNEGTEADDDVEVGTSEPREPEQRGELRRVQMRPLRPRHLDRTSRHGIPAKLGVIDEPLEGGVEDLLDRLDGPGREPGAVSFSVSSEVSVQRSEVVRRKVADTSLRDPVP
jgi:hypothetical protein